MRLQRLDAKTEILPSSDALCVVAASSLPLTRVLRGRGDKRHPWGTSGP
jgi:hypothetical protein